MAWVCKLQLQALVFFSELLFVVYVFISPIVKTPLICAALQLIYCNSDCIFRNFYFEAVRSVHV
jgi:hypothetical protein